MCTYRHSATRIPSRACGAQLVDSELGTEIGTDRGATSETVSESVHYGGAEGSTESGGGGDPPAGDHLHGSAPSATTCPGGSGSDHGEPVSASGSGRDEACDAENASGSDRGIASDLGNEEGSERGEETLWGWRGADLSTGSAERGCDRERANARLAWR